MASKLDHTRTRKEGSLSPHPGLRRANEICQKHGPYIRAMIKFHANGTVDEDDCFQEFFLDLVHARLPARISNIRQYLFRMIANDAASRARQKKRHFHHMQNYAEMRKYQDFQDDPGKTVAQREETRRVFAEIESHLPPREGKVVTCRFQMDFNTGETAEKLGVDRRSVTRYLSAGLRRIKQSGLLREGSP